MTYWSILGIYIYIVFATNNFSRPMRGDIASWQSTRFYIHSPYGHTTESDQDIDEICKPVENAYFHIPVK